MRQFKAEYYKLKYSQAKKWIAVFMVFLFFIPFVVGNDTLFMTFGDYKNIDSIGWICYINDFSNVKLDLDKQSYVSYLKIFQMFSLL